MATHFNCQAVAQTIVRNFLIDTKTRIKFSKHCAWFDFVVFTLFHNKKQSEQTTNAHSIFKLNLES